MTITKIIIFCLVLIPQKQTQYDNEEIKWWQTMAIVEYQAIANPSFTPKQRLVKNADEYIKIVDKLSTEYDITLILFPEATLDAVQTTKDLKSYGTSVSLRHNPCTKHKKQYPEYLNKISCAARKYGVIIVINLVQSYENKYYTTDVGFDYDGTIMITREDRIGTPVLHTEPIPFMVPVRLNMPLVQTLGKSIVGVSSFNPSSLVTGFRFSYEKIFSLKDIRNYIICSNWISELPFLTSLQVHQMWAQEYNVTIMFAGANNPEEGQGGSGIFHGSGIPIFMDIVATGGTRAYVYNFSDDEDPGHMLSPQELKTVDESAKEMDNFKMKVDPDLNRYKSQVVNTTQPQAKTEVCYDRGGINHFCCHFDLKLSLNRSVEANKQYTYHMVAFKGYKAYYSLFEQGGVELCAVIACLNSDIKSCGRRFPKYEEVGWPIIFENIVVKAYFGWPRKQRIYHSAQFPTSLLSSMRPIHPKLTNWQKEFVRANSNFVLERTFSLKQPQTRILTFGIFGRNFTLTDTVRPKAGTAAATGMRLYTIYLFIVLCIGVLIVY